MRVATAEHRVDAGFGVEASDGVLVGGEVTLQWGGGPRWRAGALVQFGSLKAEATGSVDRDVGEIGLWAATGVRPWLDLVAGIKRRSYSTPLALQGWTMVHLGAEARVPLTSRRVQAVAGIALMPVVAVSGLAGPDLALAAHAGMQYQAGALALAARYSLERFDFPRRGAARRLEQLSALTVFLGFPLKRARAPVQPFSPLPRHTQ